MYKDRIHKDFTLFTLCLYCKTHVNNENLILNLVSDFSHCDFFNNNNCDLIFRNVCTHFIFFLTMSFEKPNKQSF